MGDDGGTAAAGHVPTGPALTEPGPAQTEAPAASEDSLEDGSAPSSRPPGVGYSNSVDLFRE